MAGGKLILANPKRGQQTAIKTARKALKIAKGNRTFKGQISGPTEPFMASNTPVSYLIVPPDVEGQRQTVQTIELFMEVNPNLTAAEPVDYRFDIILDRTPAGETELDIAKCYGSATPNITALLDYDDQDRYKLVKSFTGSFEDITRNNRYIHWKQRSGLVCEASGQSFAIGTLTKNAYYVVYWTSEATNIPTLSGNSLMVSITA